MQSRGTWGPRLCLCATILQRQVPPETPSPLFQLHINCPCRDGEANLSAGLNKEMGWKGWLPITLLGVARADGESRLIHMCIKAPLHTWLTHSCVSASGPPAEERASKKRVVLAKRVLFSEAYLEWDNNSKGLKGEKIEVANLCSNGGSRISSSSLMCLGCLQLERMSRVPLLPLLCHVLSVALAFFCFLWGIMTGRRRGMASSCLKIAWITKWWKTQHWVFGLFLSASSFRGWFVSLYVWFSVEFDKNK